MASPCHGCGGFPSPSALATSDRSTSHASPSSTCIAAEMAALLGSLIPSRTSQLPWPLLSSPNSACSRSGSSSSSGTFVQPSWSSAGSVVATFGVSTGFTSSSSASSSALFFCPTSGFSCSHFSSVLLRSEEPLKPPSDTSDVQACGSSIPSGMRRSSHKQEEAHDRFVGGDDVPFPAIFSVNLHDGSDWCQKVFVISCLRVHECLPLEQNERCTRASVHSARHL